MTFRARTIVCLSIPSICVVPSCVRAGERFMGQWHCEIAVRATSFLDPKQRSISSSRTFSPLLSTLHITLLTVSLVQPNHPLSESKTEDQISLHTLVPLPYIVYKQQPSPYLEE